MFKAGDVVSPTTLAKKGLIKSTSGNLPRVKILGTGALDKKLTFKEFTMSESAKVAIEKAGGTISA
jgi:large subunit ribosomal protein L15